MNGVKRTPEYCYLHTVLKLICFVNNLCVRKINFAVLSDVLFFTLCAFLVSFTALRYFFKSVAVSIIISCLIAVAVLLISLFLTLKKRQKLIATTVGEGERKLLAIYLSTLSPDKLKSLFLDALDGAYAVDNRIEDDENEYRFAFKLSPINCDDIAEQIRGRGEKQLVILCCSLAPDAISFAKDFSTKTLCVGEIYPLLKKKGLLPENYPFASSVKKGVFSKVKKRFNRRLCPSLFFSGLFLLIYSFFSFYPVWYIVTGSVLTLLSAVCLFFAESG
ncbi:MAG: hypothetical protein ACI4MB_00550 [Candidatus Coproplasma sp.]